VHNIEADGLQQQKTFVATTNRKKRLQFARAYQNWTDEEWKNVA